MNRNEIIESVYRNSEYIRACHECRCITVQTVRLLDPDDSESDEVWECNICKENTGFAN